MKIRNLLLAGAFACAVPFIAQAQGIVGGAQRGAYDGSRAAGPVGGAVGAVVGGTVGGVVGGVRGVVGAPTYGYRQPRYGYRKRYVRRGRYYR